MNALVQSAVHSLGFLENGVYHREPDCFETIRDIIRYLRMDTPDMIARIECGKHNMIEHDLIPLLKCPDLDETMFDVAIRLLVNLCQPPISSMKGKAPKDREEWKLFWDLEDISRRAKKAFADSEFFRILKIKLDNYFLETDFDERDENTRLLMERIVLLIRYIFSISQDGVEQKRTASEDNCHDRVIVAFLDSGLDKTLMHISNQPKEKEFHVTILDIFALLLKEHTAEDLAKSTSEEISSSERKKTEEDFKRINEAHNAREIEKRRSFKRFGGSYVVKGMKALCSERDQVVFKPINDVQSLNFGDDRKLKKRIARNRRPFDFEHRTHLSSPEVRQKLRKMVECLIETCFNRLMKSSKQIVFEQKNVLQKTSQINYFFLVKFILRFTRITNMPISLISQLVGVEAFHENNVQLLEYVDQATTLKGIEAKSFGLKAQYAVMAYNEMVLLHRFMLDSKNEIDRDVAKRALQHIVKVEEYRDLAITLIKKFNPAVLSNTFLREIVLATHNYHKVIEKMAKSGEMRKVTKKVRVKKMKKVRKPLYDKDERCQFDKKDEKWLEEHWEKSRELIEKVVRKEVDELEDMNPLNLHIEVEDDVQQKFAMLSIQRSLRSNGIPAAIGLYHAARKIWITQEVFGKDDMTADEEIEELKQIYMTNLLEVAKLLRETEEKQQQEEEIEIEGEEGDGEGDSEDEENVAVWKTEECDFELDQYFGRYAKMEILKWYGFLLNEYTKNSRELNRAIIKMFHRVAFDLKMVSRIYQLSLFHVFMQVDKHLSTLPTKEAKKASEYYEIYEFGYHVLKRFFEKFKELGSTLAVEALFWKNGKESYDIDNGYGSYDQIKTSDGKVWSDDLESEVRNLHEEYMSQEEKPEGIDIIDFIMHNLSKDRSRKQVYRCLKNLGLDLMSAKMGKDQDKLDLNFPIDEMKVVYEEWKEMDNKDKVDVVELIRERLNDEFGPFSRKKVIKQMNYIDLNYEKPKKERSLPKWDDGLIKELEGLKEQYEEIEDAENILGVDIVRYVMKRLSEKKPIRQVERYLISMGAKVAQREKKSGESKKREKIVDFLNDSSEDEEEKKEESEEEEEEQNMDIEMNKSPQIKKKTKRIVMDSDDEGEEEKEKKEEEKENENEKEKEKPEPTKLSLKDRILNRKRQFAQLVDSSDEDDDNEEDEKKKKQNEDEEEEEEDFVSYKRSYLDPNITNGTVASALEVRETSPEEDPFLATIKYKRRIVMDDDEDDD
ncbi:unnamed protein product [Caenorhabditis angaria]|uniref:Timeless N-terminal domain-containing protein n=1 Tax=Caenorhabditis angaria TaxID=860376 RepID=A0A9P1II21_9PELO|nr:unnamed protein product [Caenorhabditis angaria]